MKWGCVSFVYDLARVVVNSATVQGVNTSDEVPQEEG